MGTTTLPAAAQFVLPGANGSQSALAPLQQDRRTVRRLTGLRDARADYAAAPRQYFMVAYDAVPSVALQEQLAAVASYVSYIPDYIYVYSAPDAAAAVRRIATLSAGQVGLKASGAMPLEFKLSRTLYTAAHSPQPQLTAEQVAMGLEVSVFEAEALDALRRTLTKWHIGYTELGARSLFIEQASVATARQLAAINYVNYVALREPAQEETAPNLRYIMDTNAIDVVNYDHKGPTGRGITFQNWERFGQEEYVDLGAYGRTPDTKPVDNWTNGHGSQVACIVAGEDNIDEGNSRGMAPGMNLVSCARWSHSSTGAGIDAANGAYDLGYHNLVANASFGWNYGTTDYGHQSSNIDEAIYNKKSLMSVYSAGNKSGALANGFSKIGYGSFTGGGAKANKNGLVVHATGYPCVDVDFAAFGPTADGRMKPEISAQGSSGTSFAAPGVTGLTGVLMEQFNTTYNTIVARTDVVKAVMLNTAMRVREFVDKDTNVKTETCNYITYRAGYGQIHPKAAVETIRKKHVQFGQKVQQGESKDFEVQVPEGQMEARFLLYWHDTPGVGGAAHAWVNDLDLVVIDPDGQEFLPWTLDPSPSNVHLAPTRTRNFRDNHEQVVLTASTKGQPLKAGTYKLRVKGTIVPTAGKAPEYVLTWQWRARKINLTSVPEGYRCRVGEKLLLTWDVAVADDENVELTRSGKLAPSVFYRTSSNGAWTSVPVHNNDNKERGAHYFALRLTERMVSATTEFRIQMGDMEAITPKVHVAARLGARPSLHALTPSSVELSWPAVAPPYNMGNGRYIVYALYPGVTRMTKIGEVNMPTTRATFLAPQNAKFTTDSYFSVAYVTAGGIHSQRSLPTTLSPDSEYGNGTDATRWTTTTFEVCGDGSETLHTIPQVGTIQWYKKEGATATPIPANEGGNARSRTFKVGMAGMYYYTLCPTGSTTPIYTSPTVTISTPNISLNDTTQWGQNEWKGYVFYDREGDATNDEILKKDAAYYGHFTLNSLGIDSHNHLFNSDDDLVKQIPGYVGCEVGGGYTNHVIVLKRRGFPAGFYRITPHISDRRVRIIFRDGAGRMIKEHLSQLREYGADPFTIRLNEQSTCEIHWMGPQLSLGIEKTSPQFTTLDESKLYRIVCAAPSTSSPQGLFKAMATNYADKTLIWRTQNYADAGQVWRIKTQGTWPMVSLQHLNTGLYAGAPDAPMQTQPQAVYLHIPADNEGQVGLMHFTGTKPQPLPNTTDANFKVYHADGAANSGAESGKIISQTNGQYKHEAHSWYIEAVERINLPISSAGWATACYPFAIKVPRIQGFKLYTVQALSADGAMAQLVEQYAGTSLPAGTPIVVEAPEKTYTVEVDYENNGTYLSSQSLFKGVTVPTQLPATAHILYKSASDPVGFYPVAHQGEWSNTQLRENRAYLDKPTTVPTAPYVGLRWGAPTGLHTAPAVGASRPALYDAAGRRVEQPTSGIYITADGQKMWVK